MNIKAARELQESIDTALLKYDCERLKRIRLSSGSEVTNLALCADVRVEVSGEQVRTVSVLAKSFVEWVFAPGNVGNPWAPEFNDIYTRGGPLVIVREITGDSVVRAVIRYLDLEQGREGY